MDCPFCTFDLDPEQTIVFATELCVYLQTSQPVLVGSGVIVPRRHCETVFDLRADELASTFALLAKAKAHAEETLRPDGYNVGWNCGTAGGQEIMHAHLHVIPRFADEPLAGRGIRHWLKQPENAR